MKNINTAAILSVISCAFSAACTAPDDPATPPTASSPASQPLIRPYGLIALPSCRDKNNRPVTFIPATPADLRELKVMFAAAITIDDRAIIAYDAETLPNTHPVFQEHVMRHECAHHKLGHNLNGGQKSDQEKAMNEVAADCDSAKSLRREKNYGPAEIDIIVDTLAYYDPSVQAPDIKGTLLDRRVVLNMCLTAK